MREIENVLCTGSHGFIGSHVVDELKRRGYNVITFDNYDKKHEDIRNQDAVNYYMQQVDCCLHLAANPYIPYGYIYPNEFFDTNAKGTLHILNAAKDYGVRVVYWSTSEVYGTAENPDAPMNEHHRIRPHSTYAVSKYAGDGLCYTYHKEHGVNVTILRQFNCYGPREKWRYVIPEIIEQLSKSNVLHLGNIYAERDFTYVVDAARAGVDIMECLRLNGQVVNVGTGYSWSVEQIVGILGSIMRPSEEIVINIDENRLRPFDVDKLKCDASKLWRYTGWRPSVGFEDGLRKTVEWFNMNNKKWNYRVM